MWSRRSLLLTSTLSLASRLGAAVKDSKLAEWVQTRVHALLPTKAERRWDEVGWTKNLVSAARLARQHRRPVFLFTHDGRVSTGRC